MAIRNPQEIIETHKQISTADEYTVGYGERYPEYDGEGLLVPDTNYACGVFHEVEEYMHDFDLTAFHNPQGFLNVLQQAGLDPIDDYCRVFRDMGRDTNTSYADRWMYVWSNNEIMVATSNNPLSNDKMSSRHADNKPGYAGGIGIAGAEPLARETAELIINTAARIKGETAGRYF